MPELNLDNLSNTFNMEEEESIEIENLPDRNNPEDIIRINIARANRILDKVESEIIRGNFSARMVEVMSGMIEKVTNAASLIQSNDINLRGLQIKEALVVLKEREIELKSKTSSSIKNQQNIIVTDRESLLKMLETQEITGLLESKVEDNDNEDVIDVEDE